ncbi:MlaC/ttg2D family ABC transporter substrate-binding protein [Thiomicrorhabdus aquaedulcis]|uniref:MlaC/ttg2D family ABC transporter substrate-binding protein n=1 Tax=Thiomicrorhabdus aquaedulcis TaxID=2211106 RepID=UPI000FDC8726|nr:ABC transporter substrate-binding protein [Thiomicrorhabdus aquaedulcis]
MSGLNKKNWLSRFLSLVGVASVLGLLLGHAHAHAAAVAQDEPGKMMQEVSSSIIDALNVQRVELEGQPEKIKAFAKQYVLPYLDTSRMARYVMGNYWRTTTEAQQKAFTDAFTTTLIRSYSQSLLKLNITSVTVKTVQVEQADRVTVPTEVLQADGNNTQVVYRLFVDKDTQKWMVYDVAIEGISMLLNYRKAYASDFEKMGVDAVVEQMNIQNKTFNSSESASL